MQTDEDDESDESPDSKERNSHFLNYAREYPVATATLAVCIVAGAAVSHHYFAADLSTPRSLLGGVLAGGGCWLLVMMGRIL